MSRQNSGNASQQAALGKRQALVEQQRLDDMRAVMALPAGRRFVARLIGNLKGNGSPLWSGNSEIHYRAARYDAGAAIEAEIREHAQRAFRLMVAEGFEAEDRAQHQTNKAITENQEEAPDA